MRRSEEVEEPGTLLRRWVDFRAFEYVMECKLYTQYGHSISTPRQQLREIMRYEASR